MSRASRSLSLEGETSAPLLHSLEALALAIEAQGSHAPDHLLRARFYAAELARHLGVDPVGRETLELAAVLHDVGELAVPQSILSKSGALTAEELDKMKTHVRVGARIAQRAGLPPAVARIVRAHHEHWDGTGYPDGLRGEAIPLGARILAVADCLAAAAPAAALQTLLTRVRTVFDPRVVQVAVECRVPIESVVRRATAAPAGRDFRAPIGAARREDRLLTLMTGELGNSLSLPETLAAFDVRLRSLIAYDCIAVYLVRDNRLSPAYVFGESAHLFCALEIPFGEGPSGVAALNREPVVNGNPWADAAHGQAAEDTTGLRSTLAIPLESGGELVAVLALYHTARNAFGGEDLRNLLTLGPRLSLAVEHAREEERSGAWAAIDSLTGLPDRRGLFQRVEAELAHCRRLRSPLALLVCEIEGLPRIPGENGATRRLSRTIAAGLRRICREEDCIARIGHTFVMALGGFSAHDLPSKRHLIESLFAGLAPLDGATRPLIPRIGAAYYPDDGASAEHLLVCADLRLAARPVTHSIVRTP